MPGELPAYRIGEIALRALASAPEACVWGVTSRGVFLHLKSGWIVYITPEEFAGPLTLNFHDPDGCWKEIRAGQPVRLLPEGISFRDPSLEIITRDAAAWSAPLVPALGSSGDQRAVFDSVAGLLLDRLARKGRQVHPLTGSILRCWGLAESFPNGIDRYELDPLFHSLESGSAPRIVRCLEPLLGLGSGLTPSGDDVITGFLLALNRWGSHLIPDLNAVTINHSLIQLSREKTTTLSANLIECAAGGQADERLIRGLDGLLSAGLSAEACADLLGGWGNTSGLDALVGMGLVCR